MSLHPSPRIQSCSKRSEQKPLVPGTLLAVVVHTKDPRLQRGKHAALKNGIYQSWQCWLRYVSYLCPEVVISIPGRMGQGQHKCLLQKESAARISAERNIIMFFTTWPSPNPPSKKQLLSSGKTPCNPLAWHPPPPIATAPWPPPVKKGRTLMLFFRHRLKSFLLPFCSLPVVDETLPLWSTDQRAARDRSGCAGGLLMLSGNTVKRNEVLQRQKRILAKHAAQARKRDHGCHTSQCQH